LVIVAPGGARAHGKIVAVSELAELLRQGRAGWPRRFPLVQFPNAPLALALGARGVAGACAEGPRRARARSLFVASLGVWAWEELADGDNWFRRLLGAATLGWIAAALSRLHRERGDAQSHTRLGPVRGCNRR
jgi:hypothetical protein